MPRTVRLAAILCLLLSSSGCDDDEKATRYACDCTFLTDTDDASIQKVEICEKTPERARSAAVGCAQTGAPATVQSCACEPMPAASVCRTGDCAVREHR
jgi:hypothetical protein